MGSFSKVTKGSSQDFHPIVSNPHHMKSEADFPALLQWVRFTKILLLVRNAPASFADELGIIHKRLELFHIQITRTAGHCAHFI
jgi:hypothetical protein